MCCSLLFTVIIGGVRIFAESCKFTWNDTKIILMLQSELDDFTKITYSYAIRYHVFSCKLSFLITLFLRTLGLSRVQVYESGDPDRLPLTPFHRKWFVQCCEWTASLGWKNSQMKTSTLLKLPTATQRFRPQKSPANTFSKEEFHWFYKMELLTLPKTSWSDILLERTGKWDAFE